MKYALSLTALIAATFGCTAEVRPPVLIHNFPTAPEVIKPDGVDMFMFKVLTLEKPGIFMHHFYAPKDFGDECVSVYYSKDGVDVAPIDCEAVGDLIWNKGHNKAEEKE